MTRMADPPELPGVEHRWVRAGDVFLHVAQAGPPDAPPVVLLHGWPQHWYVWRRVIPLLAGDFRVLAPDLRGFGWSDAPKSSYRKDELAGDVVALLDALELDRVRLAGHDWGGLAGFHVCLAAPERVSAYTALSIVHPWSQLPLTAAALAAVAYQGIAGAPFLGAAVQRFTPFIPLVARVGGAPWDAEETEIFRAPFRSPDHAEAASRVYRSFLLSERAEIHGGRYAGQRLEVPTRLVAGRGDPVLSRSRLAGLEDHGDDARVEWVDGGHWLPETHPELVAARVAGRADGGL